MNKGTPKTLDQAIVEAMCIGPASEGKDRIKDAVRDFMAQKFTKAIFDSMSDEERDNLKKLWSEITGDAA